KSLNRMFDRLQYSFAMQKQFIVDASHELKSPITLLSLFLEDSTHRQDLPESFRLSLIRQVDILQRMSRLVKNLLDLSALEMKESLAVTELDLPDLVKSVHEDYAEVVEARQIEMVIDIPEDLVIRGDRDYLHRAMVNLVDNAIKYNTKGGRIEITVEAKNTNVYVSISNSGKGIPEEDINRVFEQFYRVEKSRSLQHGGSGIGLAIVKRIIELHGGSISIESEPDAWTRVNIYLPISASPPNKIV
ncbi:MAG: HAMP domain-containing histidine kinase, partial [Desulfobacterales bacterium]|nr:HAMP domain-containing histidine kinase [Desulfobacterales bacterium]